MPVWQVPSNCQYDRVVPDAQVVVRQFGDLYGVTPFAFSTAITRYREPVRGCDHQPFGLMSSETAMYGVPVQVEPNQTAASALLTREPTALYWTK